MKLDISDFTVRKIEENDEKELYTREIFPEVSKEFLNDVYSSEYWALLAQDHYS
jgi:hypothetical protein